MIRIFISILITFIISSFGFATELSELVAPGATVHKLAGGMKFTEGPVWLPEKQSLVFSDIPNSKLMSWSTSKGLTVFRESENANGNILDLHGNLISCQHSGRNIIRITPSGDEETIVDSYNGKRLNSPNDVAAHLDGSFWFTDPPWGLWGSDQSPEVAGHWVYRVDGKTKQVKTVITDLSMPNGIIFSPDYRRLYVADTGGHPKHPVEALRNAPDVIRCYNVTRAGKLGKLLFTIDEGSDGMAVDTLGNLYTTHAGKVGVFDKDGHKLGTIDCPEGPANVTFGGTDYKTLFITARTSLYAIEMQVRGVSTPRK